MKIAQIGLRGVPPEYSGIEKAVDELSTRIILKGHKVYIYCMSGRQKDKLKMYKGMTLKYIPTIKSKNLEMIIYVLFSSIFGALRNYDVIHYHALGPSSLSFIPRCFGKKIVVTVHGLDWMRAKWGTLAKKYLRFGEWSSSRFAHRTITVSKTLEQYYKSKYGNDIYYIPNGIEPAKKLSLDEVGKELSIEKQKYILFVGRLTREKNIHLLIQAFKMIETDMKLVIVGGSSQTDDYVYELKEIKGSHSNIILTGPIYNDTLARIYSNAYLFILPSALEGMPVALLEALAYENAVLVSDIPENLEVIKDKDMLKGFTFRVGEVEDLTDVLRRLIENPIEVEHMRCMGKDLVGRKYNLDKIADETLKVYESVVYGR